VRGHVGHRRTRRTRFERACRGTGVTAGHCAALESTHACRPWQVAGPGGVDPPTGAPPVAHHWPPERRTSPAMPSASLRVLVAPAHPYLPQLTCRALISHPRPSLARTHFHPSRRRPPLPPLGVNPPPVAFLTHPST
jgi:hypothetical protein